MWPCIGWKTPVELRLPSLSRPKPASGASSSTAQSRRPNPLGSHRARFSCVCHETCVFRLCGSITQCLIPQHGLSASCSRIGPRSMCPFSGRHGAYGCPPLLPHGPSTAERRTTLSRELGGTTDCSGIRYSVAPGGRSICFPRRTGRHWSERSIRGCSRRRLPRPSWCKCRPSIRASSRI